MAELLAYCGLDCGACEAYKATIAGDTAELERIAARWVTEYGIPDATIITVTCAGCANDDARKCAWCGECPLRECARERSVASCAHCPDYGCEKLQAYFQTSPDGRARLDDLRQQLGLA